MNLESGDQEVAGRQVSYATIGKFVAVLLVFGALAAFVVQNTDSTPFQWLFISRSSPLWLIIVVSAVAGAVLSEVLGWIIRRRRR